MGSITAADVLRRRARTMRHAGSDLAPLQCAFCATQASGFDAYVAHILAMHPDRGAFLHDVVRLITGVKPPRMMIDGKSTSRFFDRLAKAFANDIGEDQGRASVLLRQVTSAMYYAGGDASEFVVDALISLAPRDGLEAMICGQMVALHSQGMEYMRRAALSNQASEGVDCNVNRATRLLRTFAALAETLRAKRTAGRQKILVKHVTVVQAGGQAIVGR